MAKKAAKKTTQKKSKSTPIVRAEEQIEKGVKRSSDWVKKNPKKATAIAVGAVAALGALAAAVFRRKKK